MKSTMTLASRNCCTSALTVASALAMLVGLGCSATSVAHRYLQNDQPMKAVRVLENANAKNPENEAAASQLQLARQRAADVLAQKAQAALDAGQPQQGLRLVQQAVAYDQAYRELENKARRQLAQAHLDRAATLLDQHEFESAARAVDESAAVAPNLPAIATLRNDIGSAHAQMLADRARSLAQAGEFVAAMKAAQQARKRLPGDETYAQLPQEIDTKRRRAQFDALAARADSALHNGELAAVDDLIQEMQRLDVRHDRLEQLQHAQQQREQRIADALDSARQAEQAGQLDQAIRLYEQATALAPQRHSIHAQREAAERRHEAATLREKGTLAFEQGAYEKALRSLNQSLDMRSNQRTAELISAARTAAARQAARKALNDNDLVSAIDALQIIVRETADDNVNAQLERLRGQLAAQALQEANHAAADGYLGAALQSLNDAMQYTNDARLAKRHAELSVRYHRQQAADAEQAGRFTAAREHWRKALALDGGQSGIAEHLKNVDALAEMQDNMRAAEQNASQLQKALASERHTNSQLHYEIEDQKRALQKRLNKIDDLKRQLSRLQYDHHQYEQTIYDLKCEVDHYKQKAYAYKSDAHHWKNKYYHCRHHDD